MSANIVAYLAFFGIVQLKEKIIRFRNDKFYGTLKILSVLIYQIFKLIVK